MEKHGFRIWPDHMFVLVSPDMFTGRSRFRLYTNEGFARRACEEIVSDLLLMPVPKLDDLKKVM